MGEAKPPLESGVAPPRLPPLFTDWFALRLLKKEGRPLVLSIHNVRPHERRGPRSVETVLHKYAYQVPDRLIVAHESLRQRLRDEFDIPLDRVSVVPLPSPVVAMATQRLKDRILEMWPTADPGDARVAAEGCVRLGISHAAQPSSTPEESARLVVALTGPFIDEALGKAN